MTAMLLLKASLLLTLILIAASLLRRAPAVTRHRLWTLAFAAMIALPVLVLLLPALYLPVPAGWGAPAAVRTGTSQLGASAKSDDRVVSDGRENRGPLDSTTIPKGTVATHSGTSAHLARPPSEAVSAERGAVRRGQRGARSSQHWSWASALLLTIWLLGTIAAIARLLRSLLRARRLACTGQELVDATWRHTAEKLATRLGLRRPARLIESPSVGTPMAGGICRPVIYLPPAARSWSAERRDVVLAHEIAHLAGHDPLRHVLTRVGVALYWFHPLAWIAARQATVAREQACDQAVLALGTRPSTYARVLLDFAEPMHPADAVVGALPMAERSLLETRLVAILNDDARPVTRGRVLIPAVGVVLLTLAVAAAKPAVSPLAPPLANAGAVIVGVAPAPPPPNAPRPLDATVVTSAALPTMQADAGKDSACWSDVHDGSSFRGNMSTSNAGGRTVIREQVGTRGADRVIQKSVGDLRLCMLAEDVGSDDRSERPSQWLGLARRVVMEARRGSMVQRLEIERQAGGGQRTSWRVGSSERAFDASAQQWRDRMLAALDTTWELSTLRGEVSSLRGQISSIHGQESSLRGEISSLRGEVSSMRGRASSIRGEESSLRGRISSIHGHVSSLRGAISSERGAISSLNASRDRVDESGIRKHEAEIARLEKEIRDYGADAKVAAVEREIAALDARGKVAAVEAEIRAFDLDGKVAAVERRIAALDVAGKVAEIERRIAALDADRRSRQLEERLAKEIAQLEAAVAAIR